MTIGHRHKDIEIKLTVRVSRARNTARIIAVLLERFPDAMGIAFNWREQAYKVTVIARVGISLDELARQREEAERVVEELLASGEGATR